MSTLASFAIKIGLDISDLEKSLASVPDKLTRFGKDLKKVGGDLTMGITAPIVGAGVAIFKLAGDFEQEMNRVKAITGATGEDFDALEKAAIKLGGSTKFSASEAAQGMKFLGQAGFDTKTILAALPATLDLAAASSMELGEAADVTVGILTGFGIKTEGLAHAVDVLAKTANATNVDMTDLGESFKYIGPVAGSLKLSMDETAAAIGLLGNAGLKAEMAGTGLRGAITNLINPTKQQAEIMEQLGLVAMDTTTGGLVPLHEIIEQLEQSGASTADMMALFGDRAGPAMLALVSQGSGALIDLTKQLAEADGSAQTTAETMNSGLKAALEQLGGAFESLAINIANTGLLEFATDLVKKVADWVGAIQELDPELVKWVAGIAAIAAALGPVLVVLGTFSVALGALISPVGLVVVALAALVAGAVAVYVKWDEITAWMGEVWEATKETVSGIVRALYEAIYYQLVGRWVEMIQDIQAKIESVIGIFRGMYDVVVGNSIVPDMMDGIQNEFGRMGSDGDIQATLKTGVEQTKGLFDGLSVFTDQLMRGMADSIKGAFRGLLEGDFSFSKIAEAFERMLKDMAASWAADTTIKALFGDTFGKSGGSLGGIVGGLAESLGLKTATEGGGGIIKPIVTTAGAVGTGGAITGGTSAAVTAEIAGLEGTTGIGTAGAAGGAGLLSAAIPAGVLAAFGFTVAGMLGYGRSDKDQYDNATDAGILAVERLAEAAGAIKQWTVSEGGSTYTGYDIVDPAMYAEISRRGLDVAAFNKGYSDAIAGAGYSPRSSDMMQVTININDPRFNDQSEADRILDEIVARMQLAGLTA